jgi:hypothetical protein
MALGPALGCILSIIDEGDVPVHGNAMRTART